MTKTYNYKVYKKKHSKIIAHFFAEVEFGVLSKNCKNYGICRIHSIDSFSVKKKKCACNSAFALIECFKHNSFKITFFKSSISSITYKKYFSNNYFKIQERYQFEFTLEHTEKTTHYVINKGEYHILERFDSYILYI